MSKKKIISLICACALVLTAIGGTLAYLTDKDKAENVFSVGSVDISLTETNKINDTVVTAGTDGKYSFNQVMPGDTITKTPVIKNIGNQEAYVRVFVTVNADDLVSQKMDAMDNFFEAKYTKNSQDCNTAYSNFFDGWGMNYLKNGGSGSWGMRFWLSQRSTDDKVLNIDSLRVMADNGSFQFAKENAFMTEGEKSRVTAQDCQYWLTYANDKGYYGSIMTAGDDELIYVFYLKLAANEEYTLFNGFKVPEEFDNAELSFFDGLEIGVYADAIQTAGFEADGETPAWQVAIAKLNEAHPMGWWKN